MGVPVALTTRSLTATKKTTSKMSTSTAKKAAALRTKKAAEAAPSKLKPAAAGSKIARSARSLKSEKAPVKSALRVEVPLRNIKTAVTPKRPAKAAKAEKSEKGTEKADKPARRRAPSIIPSELAEAMMGDMGMAGEDSALVREAARSQRERDVLGRLAVSVGRYDEMPNLELAADIVFADDTDAISVLIMVIERHDDLHSSDAARVIAEVGNRAPDLLLAHSDRLVEMIDVSRAEMLPYTMMALSPVASRYAEQLWPSRDLFWAALADLNQTADLAQGGAVRLLAAMCAASPDYARTLAGGLVDLLGKCMPKDVAFFAESVLPALGPAHSHRAKPVLDRRLKELTPAEVARLRRAQRAAQLGTPLAA
jgi:hypothetical protein